MVQPLSKPATTKKTTRLKAMLGGPSLSFLMEAHNGLSAKIAEEAGFEGIWGSGLSISAALGVRDNNEASWTQVLEVVEFMADATTVPILLDGDTGYGNFNSARRLVTKLEQRGVAGVCIEDKIFPKTNSFLRSTAQPLADMDEFAGKIRAAKEAQRDDDFVVVARVEALIAGHGMEEALKRGEAYRKAGADAVLIHSRERHPDEILAVQEGVGRPPPARDRPDQVLHDADRGLPRGGLQDRHLGESPDALGAHRDAGHREADLHGADAHRRRGEGRAARRGLPPPGRERARAGREGVPPEGRPGRARHRPRRRPRRRARRAHEGPPEVRWSRSRASRSSSTSSTRTARPTCATSSSCAASRRARSTCRARPSSTTTATRAPASSPRSRARRRRSTARASSRTATCSSRSYVLDELLETEGDFVVAVDSMAAEHDAAEADAQGRLGHVLGAALAQDAPRERPR